MNTTPNSVIYTVNSDLDDGILYAEFETKEAAMAYAKRNMDKLPFIDELEVSRDENGEIDNVFSSTTIWAHNELDYPTNEFIDDDEEDDDYWADLESMYDDEQDGKHVIGDTTWFESMNNLVETLEDNEDEVECKECFDLFPKADCVKLAVGYVCPTCAECGTVSEDDIFKMDFPEYDKMPAGNDMIPEDSIVDAAPNTEAAIEEVIDNNSFSTPEEAVPFLVLDEEEAVAGYEKAAELIGDSDLENKEEILDTIEHIKEEEEEHIEELSDLVTTPETTTEDDEIIEVENDPVSDPKEDLEELFDANISLGIDGGENNDVSVLSSHDPDTEGKEKLDELLDANVSLNVDGGTGNNVSVLSPLGGLGEDFKESGELKTWTCWYEGTDIGTVEAATEEEAKEEMMSKYPEYQYNNTDWGVDLQEELVEHVNEEHPAIESNQELEGTDNAVVDCKVADVVTHSEDEKPVACKN